MEHQRDKKLKSIKLWWSKLKAMHRKPLAYVDMDFLEFLGKSGEECFDNTVLLKKNTALIKRESLISNCLALANCKNAASVILC